MAASRGAFSRRVHRGERSRTLDERRICNRLRFELFRRRTRRLFDGCSSSDSPDSGSLHASPSGLLDDSSTLLHHRHSGCGLFSDGLHPLGDVHVIRDLERQPRRHWFACGACCQQILGFCAESRMAGADRCDEQRGTDGCRPRRCVWTAPRPTATPINRDRDRPRRPNYRIEPIHGA